jgi:hypothetical protein
MKIPHILMIKSSTIIKKSHVSLVDGSSCDIFHVRRDKFLYHCSYGMGIDYRNQPRRCIWRKALDRFREWVRVEEQYESHDPWTVTDVCCGGMSIYCCPTVRTAPSFGRNFGVMYTVIPELSTRFDIPDGLFQWSWNRTKHKFRITCCTVVLAML